MWSRKLIRSRLRGKLARKDAKVKMRRMNLRVPNEERKVKARTRELSNNQIRTKSSRRMIPIETHVKATRTRARKSNSLAKPRQKSHRSLKLRQFSLASSQTPTIPK
jgi:hypothetical protein